MAGRVRAGRVRPLGSRRGFLAADRVTRRRRSGWFSSAGLIYVGHGNGKEDDQGLQVEGLLIRGMHRRQRDQSSDGSVSRASAFQDAIRDLGAAVAPGITMEERVRSLPLVCRPLLGAGNRATARPGSQGAGRA